MKLNEEWLNQETGKYKCPYCKKEYTKNGICTHIWRKHEDGKNWTGNNDGYNNGTRTPSNQFIKAEELGLEKPKHSEETLLKMKKSAKIRANTPENIEWARKHAIKYKLGGPTHGGRGYKGRYRGYWCDSSYELVFVIYNLEHNIKFKRNTEGFNYIHDNIKRKYYPDFVMGDGSYIEIKGYLDELSESKINQFELPLTVLFKKDMLHMFEYVEHKYGNDFISLYET